MWNIYIYIFRYFFYGGEDWLIKKNKKKIITFSLKIAIKNTKQFTFLGTLHIDISDITDANGVIYFI